MLHLTHNTVFSSQKRHMHSAREQLTASLSGRTSCNTAKLNQCCPPSFLLCMSLFLSCASAASIEDIILDINV